MAPRTPLPNVIIDFNVIKRVRYGRSNQDTTPAMAWTVLDSASVTPNITYTTINTQGTTTLRSQDRINEFNVTVENQAYSLAINELSGMVVKAAPTPADYVYGFTGTPAAEFGSLELTYDGVDTDTGDKVEMARTLHKVGVKTPAGMGASAANAISAQSIVLYAKKTSTTLLGVDLDFPDDDEVFYTEAITVL